MNQNDGCGARSALVLSGGGAFGAYEVGVIQALCEGLSPATAGIPLCAEVFAGTSVGNYNAAVMAMDKGGQRESAAMLRDIWTNRIADNGIGRGNGVYRIRGGVGNYVDLRIPGSPVEQLKRLAEDLTAFGGYAARSTGRLITSQGNLMNRLAGLIDISVLLNTEPFEALVKETIEPEALRHSLRESGKSLTVTATNWGTGEPHEFHFLNLSDTATWEAICASAAIPGLFPPVSINGEIFIDGGVVMNTPIKPAIDACADEIHVISLDPSVPDLGRAYAGTSWDVMNRVLTTMVAANIDEDIESAKWINHGLDVLDRMEGGAEPSTEDGERFVRAAGVIRRKLLAEGKMPRKLTIHRYFPRKPLGGVMGLLHFERPVIDAMIHQGYVDACVHNCAENGCLLPAVIGKTHAAMAN